LSKNNAGALVDFSASSIVNPAVSCWVGEQTCGEASWAFALASIPYVTFAEKNGISAWTVSPD